MPLTQSRLNDQTDLIIGAAIHVHKALGPGLLESPYETCLTFELLKIGLVVERQKPLPLVDEGNVLQNAFRVDLIVENSIVVEVKAVDRLLRVHEAQVISYLRLTGCPIGLLFNFNVKHLMSDGFRRLVNSLKSL